MDAYQAAIAVLADIVIRIHTNMVAQESYIDASGEVKGIISGEKGAAIGCQA